MARASTIAAIVLKELQQRHRLVDWCAVLRIYVALVIYQLYPDLETGDNQFWNRSGETVNRTPDLFLRMPKT